MASIIVQSDKEPACAGCSALENPDRPRVRLEDGREATTWCECWRAECEKRHREAITVLNFASKETRLAHLQKVEDERGPVARQRLSDEVLAVWNARRAKVLEA